MSIKKIEIPKVYALLLIDIQNDFCPNGKLPITNGDKIIPNINNWIKKTKNKKCKIYASRDWHPQNHLSFKSQGGIWPDHCIQDTVGARFHKDLKLPKDTIKIAKGTRFDQEQYSAFDHTGLAHNIKKYKIKTVIIGGLAEDVCVYHTACDAIRTGFETYIIEKGTLPVTINEGKAARIKLEKLGVRYI